MDIRAKLKSHQLAHDSLWAVLGNGLGNGLMLVAGIAIARILGKELYGEYGLVKSTMFYAAMFATFGLGMTSTKYLAHFIKIGEDTSTIAKVALNITLVFSMVIALSLSILAPQVARWVGVEGITSTLRILSLIIVIRALITTQQGILSGLKQFKQIGTANIGSGLMMLVVSVPLTLQWGLNGALTALILSQVFSLVTQEVYLRRNNIHYGDVSKSDARAMAKELIRFSCPIALQESGFAICGWVGIMLLTKFATAGDVGIFTLCQQWNIIIMIIPVLLTNVVLAYLSSSVEDVHEHKKTMKTMLGINVLSAAVPFAIIFPCSKWIASLYGAEFADMVIVMKVLLIDALLYSITSVLKSEFIAQSKNWQLFGIRLAKDLLLVVGVYVLLIHQWIMPGSLAYAVAYILSSVVYLCLCLFGYWRLQQVK